MEILIIMCGVFYSVLCVFSIVTGIIYFSGKRKLNPLELSDSFVEKLKEKNELEIFSRRMGLVTFIVGIVQGISAYALFRRDSIILYYVVLGFTIFSILSVLFKLKNKVNIFPILKAICYILILIVLLFGEVREMFF